MSIFNIHYDTVVEEYSKKRERLIELYKIVNSKVFPILTARKYLMSTNELKYRETYNLGTDFQEDIYEYNTTFYLRIPQLIEILPNLEHFSNMGIVNPMINIPLIYDSIQEYIALWCWFKENYYRFNSPPIEELKEIEGVALWAFLSYNYYKNYKNVKFKINKERAFMQSKKRAIDFLNLMNVDNSYNKENFVSYVDSYISNNEKHNYTPIVSENHSPINTMFGVWQ